MLSNSFKYKLIQFQGLSTLFEKNMRGVYTTVFCIDYHQNKNVFENKSLMCNLGAVQKLLNDKVDFFSKECLHTTKFT